MDEDNRQMINIIANGQIRNVNAGSTVADLLEKLAIVSKYVVVQIDGVIVARDHFTQTVLQQGCKIEVITLVGGG